MTSLLMHLMLVAWRYQAITWIRGWLFAKFEHISIHILQKRARHCNTDLFFANQPSVRVFCQLFPPLWALYTKVMEVATWKQLPGQSWSSDMILYRRWLLHATHDDVIEWKHFPRYWPFVRGIHRSRLIPRTKASDAELWCFLWSAFE